MRVALFVRWYSTVRNRRAGGLSGAVSIYDRASISLVVKGDHRAEALVRPCSA